MEEKREERNREGRGHVYILRENRKGELSIEMRDNAVNADDILTHLVAEFIS